METAIQQVFAGQAANLEKATLRHFNAALLKTVNSKESVETVDSMVMIALLCVAAYITGVEEVCVLCIFVSFKKIY